MEKLKGRWDNDDHGTPCLVLYKNREKISDREVYEYCEEHGIRGKYLVHLVKIPGYTDNVPMDLYDPGNEIVLYELEDILPVLQGAEEY